MQELIDAFSEAPFVEGGWERALRLLASATGSSHGQLIGIGGDSLIPFNIIPDMGETPLRQFVEMEGGSPRRNFRVAASRGVMEIVHEADYDAAQPLLIDDVYNDFCHDNDIPFGFQTVLQQGDGMLIGMSVNRSRQDGRSSAEARRDFATLAPHALRAVRTQRAIDNQGAALIAGSLEALAMPAFILDGIGMVRAMTPAAQAALSAGALRLRGNRLFAPLPGDQHRLDAALSAALGLGRRETAMVLTGPDPEGGPVILGVYPMRVTEPSFGFMPRALVVLRGGTPENETATILRATYGLTPSEAAVAAEIANGVDRQEIAAARGVSPATVHAQLKTIFAKVGVSRETALAVKIRRLLTVALALANEMIGAGAEQWL